MKDEVYEEIRTALQKKQAELTGWLGQVEEEPVRTETAIQEHLEIIHSALDEMEAGTLGVCEVCNGMVDENLLRMDYTSCICLEHYSPEQRRRLQDELEMSQSVQRGLLPQRVPEIPGIELAAFSRPAEIVTGDYFDFVRFKDGSHGLVIADVSGHGVSAGLFISSLQTAFQTLAPDALSPVDVLERLNRLYIHNINLTTFVTVFFAKLDPGARSLSYANAGHPAYLYRAATDEDLWLRRTAPAIGLVEHYPAETVDLDLNPGDVMVLHTDGLTEAMSADRRQFGDLALAEVVRSNKGASAQDLVTAILYSLSSHLGGSPLDDDLTLLVVRAV